MLRRAVFLTILLLAGFCAPSWAGDCGVRGYDGITDQDSDGYPDILKLDCEDVGTSSPLMVRTSSGIRGLKLVDPETSPGVPNPVASKFRVRYHDSVSNTDVIKAIGYVLPGISSCEELQMIGFHPSYPATKPYQLGTNIDCSATNPSSPAYATSLWGLGYAARFGPNGYDGVPGGGDDSTDPIATTLSLANLGTHGFKPIANSPGTFDGKSKVVNNLYINRPSDSDTEIGLFGRVQSGSTIKDLGLQNVSITGYAIVAGLAADTINVHVTNSYVTGNVTAHNSVGGLIGDATASTVTNSWSTAKVSGSSGDGFGGLIGIVNGGFITNSFATGQVSGDSEVGSLIGDLFNSSVTNSYATGSVTGSSLVGGLVGYFQSGSMTNSYATGTVFGNQYAGGLAGFSGGSVTNSYATGAVNGNQYVGGLLAGLAGSVTNSYATGRVIGSSLVGGLVGNIQSGSVANSYWDITKTGQTNACGGGTCTGATAFASSNDAYDKTKAPMSPSSGNWDFTNVWQDVSCNYPNLRNVGGTQNAPGVCGSPCGNGTIDTGEQCDYGANNGVTGSGCSATCQWGTRITTCSALSNATTQQYNTASSIMQICSAPTTGAACTTWSPTSTTAYNATPSTTTCQYTCQSGYSWNGNACAGAGSWVFGGLTCFPPGYPLCPYDPITGTPANPCSVGSFCSDPQAWFAQPVCSHRPIFIWKCQ